MKTVPLIFHKLGFCWWTEQGMLNYITNISFSIFPLSLCVAVFAGCWQLLIVYVFAKKANFCV